MDQAVEDAVFRPSPKLWMLLESTARSIRPVMCNAPMTKLVCRLCPANHLGDGSGCDERRSRYTQRTIDRWAGDCLDSHWMGVCTGLVVARRTSVLSTVSTAELFIPKRAFRA